MKKARNTILSFLLFIILIGCNRECYVMNQNQEYNYYSFETSEIVINVTSEIESYRIVMDRSIEGDYYTYPSIGIDRDGTTAKHDVHFVNTPEGYDYDYIGDFTPLPDRKKIYKDVEIIPRNITERVVIVYTTPLSYSEPEGLIKELTVILQPKAN